MDNKAAIAIPAEVLTEVNKKLNEISQMLKPYLVSLSDEDRKTILKMSDKSQAFVQKVGDYVVTNPEFVPAYLSVPNFKVDHDNVFALQPVLKVTEQLYNFISDTAMVNGSKAFSSSLVYYNTVKQAEKNGIASARSIYDDLQQRFPSGRRKSSDPENK